MSPSSRTFSRRHLGGAFGAGAAAGAAVVAGLPGPERPEAAAAPAERPFQAAPGRRSPRPNLLFVLVDDLGWADLSCYGAPHLATPHLDRLAAQGVRFTDGYAGAPTCSPTRLSLYTGRYPGRVEAGLAEPIQAGDPGLDPAHPTLATALRDAGYTTAMIGKWHCGALPEHSPLRSGWDEFFGSYGGALEPYSKIDEDGRHDLYDGEEPHQDSRYYPRIIAERGAEFIERDHRAPWLLNLNFTTPHWPWIAEGDEEEAARVAQRVRALPPERKKLALAHTDGGSLDTYRRMVEGLDSALGDVLAALDRSGQAEDTLVVFTGDNGSERFSHTWPLDGHKSSLQEGGIRVPTIARWPARLDGGQFSAAPVITPDWTATALEVAGARPDPTAPLDGASLAGYLLRGEEPPARDLFWRQRGERALRRGKWKYHRAENAKIPVNHGRDVLFDLERDPGECADLATREPEVLAGLRAAWEAVDAGLLPYPPR
ncbi:sulfatase [Saccharopolyspora sp. MS10]|uniref:sulfatase family protein n=1 Tax=Saccharopolyspora sp. MS10 TaxID=3385973 RepID=UPI0039A2EEA1